MEDTDDEIIQPDTSGSMRLCHRGYKRIPQLIFSNSTYLLITDLDLSFNSIDYLDDSISWCIKLRQLNVSHNCLTMLPESLSKCLQLEVVKCSNNKIENVPASFSSLLCLEELDVRNNRLSDVPDILSTLPLIKAIDCNGNQLQYEVPNDIMYSGELFLWYLSLRHSQSAESMRTIDDYNQLEAICQSHEFSLFQQQESIDQITNEVNTLIHDRPTRYLDFKDNIYSSVQGYLDVIRPIFEGIKLAFRRCMK